MPLIAWIGGAVAVGLGLAYYRGRRKQVQDYSPVPFKVIKGASDKVNNKGGGKRVVAVIGSTGFLGSHVIEQLAGSGRYQVYALGRRFPPGKSLPEPSDAVFQVDMMDYNSLLKAFQSVDSVIDCAAAVPTAYITPEQSWHFNVTGTRNVVTAAKEAGVKQLVFVSGVDPAPSSTAIDAGLMKWLNGFRTADKLVVDANKDDGSFRTCVVQFGTIYGVRSSLWEPVLSGEIKGLPKIDLVTSFIPAELAASALVKAEEKLNEGSKDVSGNVLKLQGVVSTFNEFLSLPEWGRRVFHVPPSLLTLMAHFNLFMANTFGWAPLGADLSPTLCALFCINEEEADSARTKQVLGLGETPSINDGVRDMKMRYQKNEKDKK